MEQALIERYQRDGYLVLENIVDSATLDALRASIQGFRRRAAAETTSGALFDLGPGHSAEIPKLRRIKDPTIHDPAIDSLMRSDAIIDCVAPLLGGSCRFDHAKLNFKPPHGSARIEWHQDWAFYPHTNDDLLAVGVLIEDCTEANGPLMVIPGSHKGPLYDHHQGGVFTGGIPSIGDLEDQAVKLTAPAGSVTIHHVRTLHASSDNRSDRDRPLLLFSYGAVDAFPVFAHVDWSRYDAQIMRGRSTVTPRVENVPMRIPEPRPGESDSIFDTQAAMAGGVRT